MEKTGREKARGRGREGEEERERKVVRLRGSKMQYSTP